MSEEKRPLKVFLCHAHSDAKAVRAIYNRLTQDGVDAWLDKEKLLPGQDWELEIRKAVREADVVVVCLSKQFNQAGFRQKEVRLALETAMEKPEGEIFIIPARLEECENLESLRKWHWVDLFEDNGYEMLIRALRAHADTIGLTLRLEKNLFPKANAPLRTDEPAIKKKSVEKKQEKVEPEELQLTRVKSSGRYNIAIVIALILIGTILAALLGLASIEKWFSPVPTETVTATFTITTQPITPSKTLEPSPTLTPTVTETFTPVPTPQTDFIVHEGMDSPSTNVITPDNVYKLTELAYWQGNSFSRVNSIVFSPDGKYLVAGAVDRIIVWNVSDMSYLRELQVIEPLDAQTENEVHLAFSRDGKKLAYGSYNNYAQILNTGDWSTYLSFEDAWTVNDVAFSPDGNLFVMSEWKNIDFWNANNGGHIKNIHEDHFYDNEEGLAFSPDGKFLASAGYNDYAVQIWKVSTLSHLTTLKGHTGSVFGVAYSPNGKYLASGGDTTVRLWDTKEYKQFKVFPTSGYVRCVAFSPNSQLLVAGSSGSIMIWDSLDGTEWQLKEKHNDLVSDIVFSPNGTLIASASWDGTIRLWGVSK